MSFPLPFVKSSKKAPPLCRLEIRTDADFVIFRGNPNVTEPQKVKGRVVLMNSEPIDAKNICIRLQGTRRTSHNISIKDVEAGINHHTHYIRTKHTFHYDEKMLKSSPSKIPPGNHEFPFDFELPGDAHESIEGFPLSPPIHQIYHLEVAIARSFFSNDLMERKHIRVIRTLGSNPDELLVPESISGNWVGKILYEWSIGTKSLIFGDKVNIDFSLTPLADKLRIGKIRFWIHEVVRVKTEPGLQDWPDAGMGNMWEQELNTPEQTLEPPDNIPETLHSQLLLPEQVFTLTFDLPKSLNDCRQTVDVGEWIHIRHRLHISVLLHNADGHLSELKAQMPIRLYISPHLPIGEDNAVSTLSTSYSSLSIQDQATATPPAYENHTHDQPLNPFQDIDPSGFVTPAVGRSGAATPRRPNFDRTASSELMLAAASQNGPVPHDLSARLANLQTLSHISEGVEGSEVVQHVDYDLGELERITSYNTAVRNPGPANYSNLPPTYADTTNTLPSPQIAALQPAHVRSGQDNGESSASASGTGARQGSITR